MVFPGGTVNGLLVAVGKGLLLCLLRWQAALNHHTCMGRHAEGERWRAYQVRGVLKHGIGCSGRCGGWRMAWTLLCAPRQLTRKTRAWFWKFCSQVGLASYTEDAETAAQLVGSGEGLDAGAGALDEANASTNACGWRRQLQITELNRSKIRVVRCSGGGDACALRARARSRVVGCSWQEARLPAGWLCDGQSSSEVAGRAVNQAHL